MRLSKISVNLCTPAAKVPSAEAALVSESFRAHSWYAREIESTAYSTPSFCVPGDLLKCVKIFWIKSDSDCALV